MKHLIFTLTIITSTFLMSSCSDDDTQPTLEVPDTYTSANFDNNVTAERTVRTELGTLTSAANEVESNAKNGNFNSSAITFPANLEAVTNDSYATLMQSWLTEIVKAANSGVAFDLENAPTGDGGLLGSRLLEENGLELEQMLDKGSFGAALYNHALSLVNSSNITEATIDQLVEIFGAHPSFPGDDSDPDHPDAFSAEYAERRSNNDNRTGLYYDIEANLITAKAAAAQGNTFATERDAALSDFLLNWEKTNFATVIYYCNDAKGKIVSANNETDPAEKTNLLGNALHSYAEAVAFAYGWLGLSQKQITDAEITEILTLLLATPGQTPESYKFAKDASLLTNFDQAIDKVQDVYGFTESEVSGFFINN